MIRIGKYAKAMLSEQSSLGRVIVGGPVDQIGYSACPNCNGAKCLYFWALDPAGNISIPAGKHSSAKYHNGEWHKIMDRFSFPCPVCGDHRERINYIMGLTGIPQHQHGEFRLDYIRGMQGKIQAYDAAMSILQQSPYPTGIVMFWGNNGVGKSGILKSLVVQLAMAGVYSVYIRAEDILTKIRSTFGDDNERESVIEDMFVEPRLLAIDEVDIVGGSDWTQAKLRTILDKRYEARAVKSTVIATNANPDKIWPYLNSRLSDGLRILVAGESLRGKATHRNDGGDEWQFLPYEDYENDDVLMM